MAFLQPGSWEERKLSPAVIGATGGGQSENGADPNSELRAEEHLDPAMPEATVLQDFAVL